MAATSSLNAYSQFPLWGCNRSVTVRSDSRRNLTKCSQSCAFHKHIYSDPSHWYYAEVHDAGLHTVQSHMQASTRCRATCRRERLQSLVVSNTVQSSCSRARCMAACCRTRSRVLAAEHGTELVIVFFDVTTHFWLICPYFRRHPAVKVNIVHLFNKDNILIQNINTF